MQTQPIRQQLQIMVLSLCALFTALPALTAAAEEPTQAEPLVYKTTEDAKGQPVELRLHVFKPEGWSADDQRPVAVFFFGGGWVGGTPQQFYPHCRELASLGMVAVSAEYRIKGKHGTSPLACVEDGKSAVRYLRANAKSMGIDPDRIAAGGGSAGGHVAACTGVLKGFDAKAEDQAVSSVPNLMLLFNPVIDTSPKKGYGAKKVPGDDPLIISPLHHAHKDQPPSIIFHGGADNVVKIGSIRAFGKRCDQLKVTCKLVEYDGAGHGFFNHSTFRKPKKGAPDYYELTMEQAVSFLASYGFVQASAE
ncbi:MAG: alpha/beta hydrolase [Phycisphaeraceae bacterium]|nr:alpha/beta hydrolase [Phycisphaeraceae bacterium]